MANSTNAWMMTVVARADLAPALRVLGAAAALWIAGCAAQDTTTSTEPAPPAVANDAAAEPEGRVDPMGATVPNPWPATPPRGDPRTVDALRFSADEFWRAQVDGDWKMLFLFRDPDLPAEVDEARFVQWHEENAPLAYADVVIHEVVVDGRYGWLDIEFASRPRRFDNAQWQTVRTWEPWYYWAGRWLPVAREKREAIPAAPSTRSLELEPSLRARYDQWWRARFEGDFETLYELSDPIDRETVEYETFRKGHAQLDFTDHRVEWVQATGDRGGVRVSYMIGVSDPSLAKMPPQLRIVTEPWVLRDGTWYHKLIRGGS